ncbi:MAG: hypothetical protein HQM08_02860 [Candidatus Riflebacteria bacterium]|nr:hypothetical protein [Candidatus Riflebacteria bacterium]
MRRLFLSVIPDDFSVKHDVVLGPWCFLEREESFPNWENLNFSPDPFSTPQEMIQATQQCIFLTETLLPFFSQILNGRNSIKFSQKFWRVLLFPWLFQLIENTWERELRIQKFFEDHPQEPFEVTLVSDTIEWNFLNTADFDNFTLSPVFEWWLFSRILEKYDISSWKVSYVAVNISPTVNPPPLEKPLKFFFREKIFSRFFQRCNKVYGFSWWVSVLFSIFLSIKPPQKRINIKKTGLLKPSLNLNSRMDFFKLGMKTLPRIFLDIKPLLPNPKRGKKGKLQLIGPLLFNSEKDKIKIAFSEEKGENVIVTQHGGGYGTSQIFPIASEIEFKHFAFLSWGWRRQEDYLGNIIPLPSPFLSQFSGKHKKRNEVLIEVGNKMNLFLFRLQSNLLQSNEQIRYRKSKEQFFNQISPHIFRNTLYRPYPEGPGCLKDISFFKRKFPNLQICEGNLHSQLLECKLAVIDHPGTTLNISLAANCPTICFWEPKAFHMCRQSSHLFENFKKCGILFENGALAARKVNEIWENVQDWWQTKEIQMARLDWCHQYALTSKFWWIDWIKFLWNL